MHNISVLRLHTQLLGQDDFEEIGTKLVLFHSFQDPLPLRENLHQHLSNLTQQVPPGPYFRTSPFLTPEY